MVGQNMSETVTPQQQDADYLARYAAEGCAAKGQPHLFDGDPRDIYALLYCINCRMPKKMGVSLPGERVAPHARIA